MSSPAIRYSGDDTLLATFTADDEDTLVLTIQAWADQLRASSTWREVVAGFDSLCVQFDLLKENPANAMRRFEAALKNVPVAAVTTKKTIEIPVCYGGDCGPDFERIAKTLGLSHADIIRLHSETVYTVQMLGFTPGFAYCGPLNPALKTARLSRPRQRVESGSIGIAGTKTGIYALHGPGGWPIIGRTPKKLFDAHSSSQFLLQPGVRIRFTRISQPDFQRLLSDSEA